MVANDFEEKKLIDSGYKLIAGIDESGMGSLAGEVHVGVVVLPVNIDFKNLLPEVNDSKQKSQEEREKLYELIKKHAVSYAVATATIEEIDKHNIYWARFIAARRAIESLKVKPDYILMDGNAVVPEIEIPQTALVKGDTRSISIAAASILAKVERDAYMMDLASRVHEDYGWITNKAYYTKKHLAALEKYGKTKWHREGFLKKFNVGGKSEKIL